MELEARHPERSPCHVCPSCEWVDVHPECDCFCRRYSEPCFEIPSLGCLWGIWKNRFVAIDPVEMDLATCFPEIDQLECPSSIESIVVKSDPTNRVAGDVLCFASSREEFRRAAWLVVLPCVGLGDASTVRQGYISGMNSRFVSIAPGLDSNSLFAYGMTDSKRNSGDVFLVDIPSEENDETTNIVRGVYRRERFPSNDGMMNVVPLSGNLHFVGCDRNCLTVWNVEKTDSVILNRAFGSPGIVHDVSWMGASAFLVYSLDNNNLILHDLRAPEEEEVHFHLEEDGNCGHVNARIYDRTLVTLSHRNRQTFASVWDVRRTATSALTVPFVCHPEHLGAQSLLFRVRVDDDFTKWRFASGRERTALTSWSLDGRLHLAMDCDQNSFGLCIQRFV